MENLKDGLDGIIPQIKWDKSLDLRAVVFRR
jgi:hypothetical protein